MIMTLENAKVLHKHFMDIGRVDAAKQLEERYPDELRPKPEPAPKPVVEAEEEIKEEVKKSGKVRKG
jgi:hypothetical protein